jgi:RNA polymerase sigma-70 factor (ECF subfamily)
VGAGDPHPGGARPAPLPPADRPSADGASAGPPSRALDAALDAALARFADAARRLARRTGLGADDLDELLQEVRIRLWRALGTPERIREVRALYIQRTVASAAMDLIRRRRARRELPLDPADGETHAEPPAPGGADRELDRAEFDAAVARALEELAEPRRVVVRLHLTGYDREEIARMLGWSEPKTRNLLYRGLGDLREALERAGLTPREVR